MSLTDRCGNPTTFTPSTSAAEEVGMEPLEKKRREARAWVLRAASWKEFMVVTCCLYLGSYVVLEVERVCSIQQKDFLMAKILTCTISNVEILRVSATVG